MKSKRFLKNSKRPDTQALKKWLSPGQTTTSLGVVRKFPGEDSHFEISTENGINEILVDVELIPSGTRVQCRLGFGNDGMYRIPRENSEVAVILPYDTSSLIQDPMDFEPIIVGVLNVNAPNQLTDVDTVVIDAVKVRILNSDIQVGSTPGAQDGVVVGSGIDSFTGSTYFALGNSSAKVKAQK